jgi:hypothetical protein
MLLHEADYIESICEEFYTYMFVLGEHIKILFVIASKPSIDDYVSTS